MNRTRSGGFTLVELLVVIAIIGILIALLLPAVQSAREAARRIECSNHFKQVGIALHNYHSALGSFPTGLHMWIADSCPGVPDEHYYGWSWSAFLLPYLELKNIHDQIDFKVEYYLPGAREPGSQRIPLYICPSDPNGGAWIECCSGWSNDPGDPTHDFRMANMCGVADSTDYGCGSYFWPRVDADGVFFNRHPVKVRDIIDGTSHTLAVGEITGAKSVHPSEGSCWTGYMWITWNIQDTHHGINGFGSLPGGRDDEVDPLDGDGGNRHVEMRDEVGFCSWHPGGCHFLIADGSVHFLSENIDQTILAELTTRAGGEAIEHFDF